MEIHAKIQKEETGESQSNFLGIDIGTTSVKVCVINRDGRSILQISQDTNSETGLGGLEHEQDPFKIIDVVEKCMLRVDPRILTNIVRIGICGQMHGVCLWKYDANKDYKNWKISNLYTWMDRRCNSAFIESLPHPNSHLKLSTGQGCLTMLWLSRFRPSEISDYDSAGTIMDLLVSLICHIPKPVMSDQNAASLGYFDTKRNEFNIKILESAKFPMHLLPKVVRSNSVVGELKSAWFGVRPGTTVGAALGDLQCSVFATFSNSTISMDKLAFLNFSTSAQIGFISQDIKSNGSSGVEYFPFFNESYLAVGASLNGGNVLSCFINSIKDLVNVFGTDTTTDNVWEVILNAANSVSGTELKVLPLLFGERHLQDASCSIANLNPSNTNISHFFRATCRGLVENLARFISPQELAFREIGTLVASGSALHRNPVLQQELRAVYGSLNVIIKDLESTSAYGAAEYQRSEYRIKHSDF